MFSILQIPNQKEIKQTLEGIGVDPYGIKIMLPKAQNYLIKVNGLSNILANILKQELLSLGADAAVSREALTGKAKRTDCLIMGTLAQFSRLSEKLKQQPFGLNRLAQDLSSAIKNYRNENINLILGEFKLNLRNRSYIMGIVNVTPDSFSGDGLYDKRLIADSKRRIAYIADYAQKLAADGADIIDIGGESSRPGAKPVSLQEELARVIPVIKTLAKKIKTPISIDTHKPEVAKQALDNGASMVNDISALKNKKMLALVSRSKAAVVIMHMQGNPYSMQKKPSYVSVIDEIIGYLQNAINRALQAGIKKEKIVADPGIGFGKTIEHNLEILKRLKEFKVLGQPVLVGTSRKSFIGKILNSQPQERIFGTIGSCIVAADNGANILRVHDVKAVKQALLIRDSIAQ